MGHNWKAIVSNHFPGRTALQARNQYNKFCRRTGFDAQPPTPCSMQCPATPVPTDRALSHISPTRTKSRSSQLRKTPTDTDLEHEESDYNLSGEEEIHVDDDDDADWPQSENCSQWDLAKETDRVQSRHSASHQYAMSPQELEYLKCSLPSGRMMPSSSFNYLSSDQPTFAVEDDQALGQPSSQPYTSGQVCKGPTLCARAMTDTRYLGLMSRCDGSVAVPVRLDQPFEYLSSGNGLLGKQGDQKRSRHSRHMPQQRISKFDTDNDRCFRVC